MTDREAVHGHRVAAGHARIRAHGDHEVQLAAAFTIVLARIDEDFHQRGYDLDNPLCDVAGLLRDLRRNPELLRRSEGE